MFYLCTEIITFPLKGRLSSFIVSGKFPYRVKFYTKGNGPMERYCAREDVGLAGNDRMLTLSIGNMRDDKAYISIHNAEIKKNA